MRLLALLLSTSLLALAPRLAPAQQHDANVVDLDTVETTTEAPRSAFGRVVDVMIASLMEQQQADRPQRRGAHAKHGGAPAMLAAKRAGTSPSGQSAAEPRIEISLGERFALPPANAVASQAVDRP